MTGEWTSVLAGVVPPLISPLDAADRVDREGMARLVEHLLDAGCSGLFVNGGCGEGPWRTWHLGASRRRVVAVPALARSVPSPRRASAAAKSG